MDVTGCIWRAINKEKRRVSCMERLHLRKGIFIMPELLDGLLDLVGIIIAGYFLQPSSLNCLLLVAVKRGEYSLLFTLQHKVVFQRGKVSLIISQCEETGIYG